MLSVSLATCLLATAPIRVAVLPFQNDTALPDLAVLRQGLADLVLTDLVGTEGVQVVERTRFAEVVAELELQQTKLFDATQTVKLGRMLGATHLVAGTLVSVAPKVKLAVRLIELSKNEAIVKASVEGSPTDLFELEERLVQQLVTALHAKFSGTRSGHASLPNLVTYAQGLALADEGKLDQAKSKLAELVRTAPDFALAQERYADVLARLRAAQKTRTSSMDEVTATLTARLTAQLNQPPLERALGARIALANLTLLSLSRVVGAKRDEARFIEPSKLADVEKLEAQFVGHATALIAELRKVRGKNVQPALDDGDAALGERTFGLDLATWDFATPSLVATELATFLGSGWTPYRSDVPQFALRPSASQRSAPQASATRSWFDVARKELPLDKPQREERVEQAMTIANEHAEWLVLLGRPKEAVAQWQGFLDAHPTAKSFNEVSAKLMAVLLLDDDAERDEQALAACDLTVLARGAKVANRTWRARGFNGLFELKDRLRACGKKTSAFRQAAWSLPAAELRRVADCPHFEQLRAEAQEEGVALEKCQ